MDPRLNLYCPKIITIGDGNSNGHDSDTGSASDNSSDDADANLVLPVLADMQLNINVLHRRMGHAGWDAVKQLAKQLDLTLTGSQEHCEVCHLTKAQQIIGHTPQPRTTAAGELLHVDSVGPISTPGLKGERYFLLITDDYSHYHWGYTYQRKSEAFALLRNHLSLHYNQTGENIKRLRIDAGTEFSPSQLKDLCSSHGIKLETSAPYHSYQNGKAEKANHLTEQRIRSILCDGNLPAILWPEAFQTALRMLNRTPTRINPGSKTPFQVISEFLGNEVTIPTIKHWRRYGCTAYVHVPKQTRVQGDKFAPRATKGQLVGYEGDSIYRIYLPDKKRVIRTSHVTFDEDDNHRVPTATGDLTEGDKSDSEADYVTISFGLDSAIPSTSGGDSTLYDALDEGVPAGQPEIQLPELGRAEPINDPVLEDNNPIQPHNEVDLRNAVDLPNNAAGPRNNAIGFQFDDTDSDNDVEAENNPVDPEQLADPPLRERNVQYRRPPSTRTRVLTEKGAEYRANIEKKNQQRVIHMMLLPPTVVYCFYNGMTQSPTISDLPPEPTDWNAAMKHPLSEQWKEAAEKELSQHVKNGTWKAIPFTKGMRLLKMKWVFKYKANADGKLALCKARLVARGDKQRPGLDFLETYASVVRSETFKTIMALVTVYDLECVQLDVVCAFINSRIDKDNIIVHFPAGVPNKDGSQVLAGHLQKALYGLKQAPLLWQQEITSFLKTLNFRPLDTDPCVFQHSEHNALIIIYVDDILLIHSSVDVVSQMKKQLSAKYELRDLGDLNHYLGMKIIRNRSTRTMYISQETYIQKILRQYHMADAHGARYPMDANGAKLTAFSGQADENFRSEYQSIIGSLGYAANITRADIAFAVHKLCQFAHNPSDEHMGYAKHVLRYLKEFPDLAIRFQAPEAALKIPRTMNFGQPGLQLVAYSDAAFADNLENRSSSHAYVFMAAGGIIAYKSGKQTITATSSTEAEYIGLSNAAKEATWLQRLLQELGYRASDVKPLLLYGDNLPSHSLTEIGGQFRARTKHIDIHYHYIRQQVANGTIKVEYIRTDDMIADGLTKPLLSEKYKTFIKQLGMVSMKGITDTSV